MSDYPCHGSTYNNLLVDHYAGGDKRGRKIPDLLHELRVNAGVNTYHFSHITEYTQKMVGRFVTECGDPAWVSQDKIGNELEDLTAKVRHDVGYMGQV